MQSLPNKFDFFFSPVSLLSCLSVFASIFGVFSPSPAEAQNSYNAIKNAGGKCMDVQNGYTSKDRTPIQIWDCHSTPQPSQQWRIVGEAIINYGGRCLDIQDGKIDKYEQPLWLYACNGSPAQRWIVNSSGEIRNPVSNLCLDVKNGKTGTAGTSLQIYGCNGTIAQTWDSASSYKINAMPTLSKRMKDVTNDVINTWMSKIKSGPQGSTFQNGFSFNVVESSSGDGYADGRYDISGTGTITVTPAFFKLSYAIQKKVMMHEMGHVMGFGQQRSIQYMNLVRCGPSLTNCSLIGNNITAAYGNSAPLQGNFYSKSRPAVRTDGYFHFAEGDSKLSKDLMSAATLEGYSDNDLRYTIAAFKDMGFVFK